MIAHKTKHKYSFSLRFNSADAVHFLVKCIFFKVNLAEKSALVCYKSEELSAYEICEYIEDMGFEARIFGEKSINSVCCIHVDGMTCNSCVQTIEG